MDSDLASMQEVRDCLRQARDARLAMESASQEDCDRWAQAIADAGRRNAMRLAKMAVQESGFGVVAGKTVKNKIILPCGIEEPTRSPQPMLLPRKSQAKETLSSPQV